MERKDTTSLVLRPKLDGRKFIVEDDYVVYVECSGFSGEIKIPAGFETDLASIPKIFWSWIPPCGKHSFSAVIHDYLYCMHEVESNGVIIPFTKKQADEVFYNKMVYYGVPKLRAKMMYYAVRAFGRKYWKK